MLKRSFFLTLFCFFCLTKAEIKKSWTIAIYMAANNDLEIFAKQNIRQMMQIGSNEIVNIIIFLAEENQTTKENYAKIITIEKENKQIIKIINDSKLADSGDSKTLIQFCNNAIKEFPADHYALIFWNHGTGILDPSNRKMLTVSEIFEFDFNTEKDFPHIDMLADFEIIKERLIKKGVCFDEITGSFLREKDLDFALKTICNQSLNGGKFDIIGFDTCLMAMIEVMHVIKNYAHFMVASQEVERGSGWNYKKMLSLVETKNPSPLEFAKHIVMAYAKTYHFANDYTLSCVDLSVAQKLENNIKNLALLLNEGFSSNPESVAQLLRTSRYKHTCLYFDEPDYIDLDNFFRNLLQNIAHVAFADHSETLDFKKRLTKILNEGLDLIKKMVIANKTGSLFNKAKGISIYFPERLLHKSYKKSQFSINSQWLTVIQKFLAL